jgi:hypothetical protein
MIRTEVIEERKRAAELETNYLKSIYFEEVTDLSMPSANWRSLLHAMT